MAGGKLSPRQKMINLMYLVFIAMLALNMSKEVLSAFGLMNERLEESNVSAEVRNSRYMATLEQKATEQPDRYAPLVTKAQGINSLSKELQDYIAGIKNDLQSTVKPSDIESGNYQVMDKDVYLNEKFFKSGRLTPEGQEFVNKVDNFRQS